MIFMLASPNEYLDFKTYGFDLTKTFASGEVYISSIIDKLMCQAYYDPAYLNVLNQIVLGTPSQDKENKDINSNLYPMHFQAEYIGKEFNVVFKVHLLDYNIFIIALYRSTYLENGETFSYIVTNPDPELVIDKSDVALVLANKVPDEQYYTWSFEKDINFKGKDSVSVKEQEIHKSKIVYCEKSEEELLGDVKNRISALVGKAEKLLKTAELIKSKKKDKLKLE